MTTVALRPDHDTTPHCDLCGAEGIPLSDLPIDGILRTLCEDCEDCADPPAIDVWAH